MVEGESGLLDLVGEFYDCAIDKQRWPRALGRLTSLLNGHDATLTLNGISDPKFSMRAQWNLDETFEAAMQRNYASNPLLPSIWYTNIDEPISLLTQLDEDEVKATQWYQRTMGKFGYRDAAISILAKSTDKFGAVSIQSKDTRAPFSQEELLTFRKLVPHIRRAAFISDLLHTSSLREHMLATALDKLSVSIILTDRLGRVVHTNEPAKSMLASCSALSVKNGAISASNPQSHSELLQAIRQAGDGTTIEVSRSGAVTVLLEQGKPGYAAWILPLDRGLRSDLAADYAAEVAIFVKEIGDTRPLPAELFVRRFGITPSECRVLLLLVQGQTLQEISVSLGTSLSTVKTHLARLLQKTDSRKQADLVRLAMSVLTPTAG